MVQFDSNKIADLPRASKAAAAYAARMVEKSRTGDPEEEAAVNEVLRSNRTMANQTAIKATIPEVTNEANLDPAKNVTRNDQFLAGLAPIVGNVRPPGLATDPILDEKTLFDDEKTSSNTKI